MASTASPAGAILRGLFERALQCPEYRGPTDLILARQLSHGFARSVAGIRLVEQTSVVFFNWVLESGQPEAESLAYVPLPPNLVERIKAYWKAQFAGWK